MIVETDGDFEGTAGFGCDDGPDWCSARGAALGCTTGSTAKTRPTASATTTALCIPFPICMHLQRSCPIQDSPGFCRLHASCLQSHASSTPAVTRTAVTHTRFDSPASAAQAALQHSKFNCSSSAVTSTSLGSDRRFRSGFGMRYGGPSNMQPWPEVRASWFPMKKFCLQRAPGFLQLAVPWSMWSSGAMTHSRTARTARTASIDTVRYSAMSCFGRASCRLLAPGVTLPSPRSFLTCVPLVCQHCQAIDRDRP